MLTPYRKERINMIQLDRVKEGRCPSQTCPGRKFDMDFGVTAPHRMIVNCRCRVCGKEFYVTLTPTELTLRNPDYPHFGPQEHKWDGKLWYPLGE